MNLEAANRVLDDALTAGPRCGDAHVIAIDGPTGSGKTTLAEKVATVSAQRSLSCRIVHTDLLCPGWDGLPEVPAIVESLLSQLARGEAITPTWDWHAGRRGADAVVSPANVVIIEGVGAGARRSRRYLSTTTWLDAPVELRKERALSRDGDMFAPHWDAWAEAERRYFADELPQA